MKQESPQSIIETVFSHDAFQGLDQEAVLALKNPANAALCTLLSPAQAPLVQISTQISEIPSEGIIITQSGKYTLQLSPHKSNILWEPKSEACAAITIAADNVELDMNGVTLTAKVADSSQPIVGIYVQGYNNISISNGTLINMCQHGILANNITKLSLENLLISGLQYNNLNERGATPSGIRVCGSFEVAILNCDVQYIYATADASAGIQLLGTVGAIVSACKVSHLVNYAGSVQGYSYFACSGVVTTNCHAAHFQSHFGGNIRATGHSVLGFLPMFSLGLDFQNCSSSHLTGCNDDCHGMSAFFCVGVIISDFKAQYITDGVCPENTGAKATGLELYAAEACVSNCAVDNIKAINPQDKQSAGFSVWGGSLSFTSCIASNIIVCDASGDYQAALGYGIGYGWAPDPRLSLEGTGAHKVEYNHCAAVNCNVGFDTWMHIDSIWADLSYTNCDVDILVQPEGKRILSGNPASECNPPITTVIDNIARGNLYPLTY